MAEEDSMGCLRSDRVVECGEGTLAGLSTRDDISMMLVIASTVWIRAISRVRGCDFGMSPTSLS